MVILGLNAFHGDSAAAIVRDGKLVAAAEEERFRRIKHWAGFPSEAIRWCLEEAGARLADVDHVAVNQDNRANMARRASYVARTRPSLGLLAGRLKTRRRRAGAAELLEQALPGQSFKGRLHAVEHHRAHLSSAFHVSPFSEAVVASVDGFGDFASAAWGVGSGTRIDIDRRVHFPHSLGVFYQAVTQHLGFPHYGDEYKVMGLAPYGQPTLVDEMRRLVRSSEDGGFALDLNYFRHHSEGVAYQWDSGSPEYGDLFSPELEALLGARRRPDEAIEQRHMDLARSAQAVYEEAFFGILDAAHARHGLADVALAGGCANNSVANGKIRRKTPFRRVYVHAAPGDAGGAIGAAFSVWHDLGGARSFVMDHAFWGPAFSQGEISAALDARRDEIAREGCRVETVSNEAALCA